MRSFEAEKARASNDTLAIHLLAVSEAADVEGGDACGHTADLMYILAVLRRLNKRMVGVFCAAANELIEAWVKSSKDKREEDGSR